MNRKLPRPLLFALAFFVLPLLAREAAACGCMGERTPCEAYWASGSVFVGKVGDIESLKVADGQNILEQRVVRLAVSETLRGEVGPEAEVVTGMGEVGDCGYPFLKGVTYLVYANRSQTDGRLHTSRCSRTRPVKQGGTDLAYARSLASATPGAAVFGEVRKQDSGRMGGQWSSVRPVASAEVKLAGGAIRRETRTDKSGHFSFEGLPADTYLLTLKVPPGLASERPLNEEGMVERKVTVVERGCEVAGFMLEADTRVGGRVLDAGGRPVSNVLVWLRQVPSDESLWAPLRPRHTDAEGRYEFERVRPGGYLLEVRALAPRVRAGRDTEYPSTFYPKASSEKGAEVIEVKEGDRLLELDVRLPTPLEEYGVEVFVTYEDGRPAPGAAAYLWPQGGGNDDLIEHRADGQGHFTLKVYEGLRYSVTAVPPDVVGGADESKRWVAVPPAPGSPPLRLVAPTPTPKD